MPFEENNDSMWMQDNDNDLIFLCVFDFWTKINYCRFFHVSCNIVVMHFPPLSATLLFFFALMRYLGMLQLLHKNR